MCECVRVTESEVSSRAKRMHRQFSNTQGSVDSEALFRPSAADVCLAGPECLARPAAAKAERGTVLAPMQPRRHVGVGVTGDFHVFGAMPARNRSTDHRSLHFAPDMAMSPPTRPCLWRHPQRQYIQSVASMYGWSGIHARWGKVACYRTFPGGGWNGDHLV